MSDEKRSYLVAYDINDDRRRDHVAKIFLVQGNPAVFDNASAEE